MTTTPHIHLFLLFWVFLVTIESAQSSFTPGSILRNPCLASSRDHMEYQGQNRLGHMQVKCPTHCSICMYYMCPKIHSCWLLYFRKTLAGAYKGIFRHTCKGRGTNLYPVLYAKPTTLSC